MTSTSETLVHGERNYRLALILGALTAIGPLAIDMYLPSLPTIAREFRTTAAAVQASLAAYYIGIAIGQALYGPLSDRVGRRPPVATGLFISGLSSVLVPSTPPPKSSSKGCLTAASGASWNRLARPKRPRRASGASRRPSATCTRAGRSLCLPEEFP